MITPRFYMWSRKLSGILDLKGCNTSEYNKNNILECVVNSLKQRRESYLPKDIPERPRAIFLAVSCVGSFKRTPILERESKFHEILEELNNYGEILIAKPQKNSGTGESTEVIPALFLPKYDLIEEKHDISNVVGKDFVELKGFSNKIGQTHCCACPTIKIGDNIESAVDMTTIRQYRTHSEVAARGDERCIGKPFRIIIANSANNMNKYQNLLEERGFGELEYTTDSSGEILYGLASYNRSNMVKYFKESKDYAIAKARYSMVEEMWRS